MAMSETEDPSRSYAVARALRHLSGAVEVSETEDPKRSYAGRWKHEGLFRQGYLAVPTTFLRLYAELKPQSLTSGEALFVLHLMAYKWGEDAPFPSYKTLAKRMGVSTKMVRRHAQSLETKGYLERIYRRGETNRFDLNRLFDKLNKTLESDS